MTPAIETITPVTPEEVERIAERMKICIGCEKANYTRTEPQPEAATFIPRTLRLAFTRAEYIHGVQGLTCKDRPGCCELSRAMKEGECEKWKQYNCVSANGAGKE